MKNWKVILWIKVKNTKTRVYEKGLYETIIEARTKEGAILAARQEVEKEYTIIGVKSAKRI